MHKFTLIFIFVLSSLRFFSQKDSDFELKFNKVEEVVKEKNYERALPMYIELYNGDTANANLCYKIGFCYLQSGMAKEKAVQFLEKAVKSVSPTYKEHEASERNAPILAYKLLGDAYHTHSKFDKAINAYNLYRQQMIKYHKSDKENEKEATRKIEMCNTAKELMVTPVRLKVENMGKSVNSKYPDYSCRYGISQTKKKIFRLFLSVIRQHLFRDF